VLELLLLIIVILFLFASELVEPQFCRLMFSFTSTKESSIEVHIDIYIMQDGSEAWVPNAC
jgi:hypothetical protein